MDGSMNNTDFASLIQKNVINNIEKYKEKISYITLQESTILNSALKYCDIVGCKLFDNRFDNVSLNNADIISLQVSNCCFSNVCFDGTCIEDIDFRNCVFTNCSFKNFTMKNCLFNGCRFYGFKPYCCLCELNSYIECSFVDSSFSSSYHYQIFSNCLYFNTDVEAELLGYNYGLLSDGQIILKDFSTNSTKDTDSFECLYENYLKRKLYTNAFILKINLEYTYNTPVLLQWAEYLETILKNNIIVKSNEIVFIKNIISLFSKEGQIAPLLLFALNKKLISIINNNSIANTKIRDDIILLINSIYFDYISITQSFSPTIKSCLNEKKKYMIEIKYLNKPKIDLSQILNLFGKDRCQQLKTATGSFYEWISCPDNIATCLEIFLMLLGITVPIVYDSKKNHKREKTKRQSSYLDLTDNSVSNMTINITINNGCNVLNNYSFVENNFYGYDNSNIQKIKVSVEKQTQVKNLTNYLLCNDPKRDLF